VVGQTVDGILPIRSPLSSIPVLGPILFEQDILVYVPLALAVVFWVVLFRTNFGLSIRSVGENPEAADSIGVNVYRVRYVCILVSGMLGGLGGAYLSLAYTRMWIDGMTVGRGFLAVLLCVFAMRNPIQAVLAAYIFGVIWSVPVRIQNYGVTTPIFLLNMLPYAVSIVVLVVLTPMVRRRATPPASLGKPYVRGKKE